MQRPVHLSLGWVKTLVDGRNMGGRVVDRYKNEGANTKMKEQKRSSKAIDIVSYALEVSVNSVTCVFVRALCRTKLLPVTHVFFHFRSSDTF